MSGYQSRAQQRYFNARAKHNPRFAYYAAKKNAATKLRVGGYSSLPWRKRGPTITSLRKLF